MMTTCLVPQQRARAVADAGLTPRRRVAHRRMAREGAKPPRHTNRRAGRGRGEEETLGPEVVGRELGTFSDHAAAGLHLVGCRRRRAAARPARATARGSAAQRREQQGKKAIKDAAKREKSAQAL